MMHTSSDAVMKNVLVTGGTGFLGAWIIRQLIIEGYQVSAIKRNTSELPFFIEPGILQKVNWVEGDVLDIISLEEAMQGIEAVVHAAAIVSFHKADRKNMYNTNIQGTANVVNIAMESGIKRMVHISSVAALGRTKDGVLVDEKKAWTDGKVNTHYAISKYQAEMEMWRGMAEGLDGVIINPSTILGYGNWSNSSCAIFKNVFEGFPWYTNGVNGFVYVEDVARATVSLLQSDINGERFIVNGENWSFRQLFNTIADGFGKKQPHREATALMGELAWRLEKVKSAFTGKQPLLSRESAKVAQSKTHFDNSKLLEAIPGFQFTPLHYVIRTSCERYLQQHLG
ncbi:NAD-dependent epimerase/dehydratase family protein [Flavihumibacter profundi]|jgi:dihydroflavonol-4-reductase|uniref:NAD-dependent epimerase/dehydratase family protein n=1 Tax=Flavihumibacter profundi TaxID=2716883 RepID=UPI001CC710E7|nr:NAD-dependent epimerase/dehydratase family protein [Flavihumibacter profundi]MBZ5857893.1 NAD-dependent epimerase/dehydratase family protein [Flavihumibacter profundi]